MMRATMNVVLLLFILIFLNCAATTRGIKFLDPPDEDGKLIVGNVLVENINQEFAFDNWGMGIRVVVVGRTDDGTMKHFEVETNADGYYFVANVPPGQYILKAVILYEVGSRPIKIVNDLLSFDSRFYRARHPEEPVEYSADWLPPLTEKGKIINLNIVWFGLRAAYISDLNSKSIGEVLMAKSTENLDGKRFYDKGYPYTRLEPVDYFKEKFSDAAWWN